MYRADFVMPLTLCIEQILSCPFVPSVNNMVNLRQLAYSNNMSAFAGTVHRLLDKVHCKRDGKYSLLNLLGLFRASGRYKLSVETHG